MTVAHQVDMLIQKLLGDEAWQGEFTDSERAIWLHAVGCFLRERGRNGFDLEMEYKRVHMMLSVGARMKTTKSG